MDIVKEKQSSKNNLKTLNTINSNSNKSFVSKNSKKSKNSKNFLSNPTSDAADSNNARKNTLNLANLANLNQDSELKNIEFSKLQGFDVLEKLPEKSVVDNYNEQFYSTLNNLKFLSLSIPDEDRLFYHFEENENASVSATTGQILKTFVEVFKENLRIKRGLMEVKNNVGGIFKGFDSFDQTIIDAIRPEILAMEKRLQTFLVEQKTEKFRLLKEIALLQKEKAEIKEEIEKCVKRLERLEREIGARAPEKNLG